jgi:hypothetical protein
VGADGGRHEAQDLAHRALGAHIAAGQGHGRRELAGQQRATGIGVHRQHDVGTQLRLPEVQAHALARAHVERDRRVGRPEGELHDGVGLAQLLAARAVVHQVVQDAAELVIDLDVGLEVRHGCGRVPGIGPATALEIAARGGGAVRHSFPSSIAMPWPPPMHSVTRP